MRSAELEKTRNLLIPMFHTETPIKELASKYVVSPKALRGWWADVYGTQLVFERGRRVVSACSSSRKIPLDAIRVCRCGVEYTGSRFPCTSCERAANKRYRERQTLEEREKRLQKQKVQSRRYYEEHAEALRKQSREYSAAHRDTLRIREKKYYTSNPGILLLKSARKRAKERGLPCSVTVEDIRGVTPLDGCCPITREPFQRGDGKVGPRSMTLDRVIPELGYVPGNITVISHLANTIKQNCTDPRVFRRLADYIEAHLEGI